MREVTLSEMVALCQDCSKMCWEKTSRVVENVSRAPRGWEDVFKSVAEERRREDNEVCVKFCTLVKTSCPASSQVAAYEKVDFKKVKKGSYPAGVPSIQEMTRCEHAVEKFTNVLFTLAHKPSKVSFGAGSTPEQDASGDGKGKNEPPTEAHRKVLEGAKVDDEIVRRWSAARQGRIHMEEQGVVRTPQAAEAFKQELKQQDRAEKGGTTPRW